jgi:hypothetical protein
MITANNYFEEIERVGVNNLPQTLKETHDYVVRATENGSTWDNYHNSEKIKRLIDLHLQKVNELIVSKQQKNQTATRKEARVKSPEAQQRASVTRAKKTKPKLIKQKVEKINAKKVEHIREEVKFIKRFVALHNKIKSPHSILTLIKSLQRAIVQKLIRKTSPLANEIMAIQDRLISAYNRMKGDESFKIKDDELSKLVVIAGGEQVYPSINIIKRYIGLQGKNLEGDTIRRLLKQVENALDKKTIAENDPYIDKVKGIYNSLKKKSMGEKLSIAKAELNSLAGIVEGCTCKDNLGKIYKTNGKSLRRCKNKSYSDASRGACSHNQGLSGVLTAEQMANRKLDLLNFFSFWLTLFGMPARNFTAMFHGEPHNGKTIFLLKLAQYLAENFGNVIYVSSEEFASPTMTKKVSEFLNPFPARLHFAENLKDPNLSQYAFVILDSVNDLGLKIHDYKEMRKSFPDTAFIFILQHTKAGDFKGGKDWEHTAEIVGEVHKGVVTITKNRYAPKTSLNFFKQFGLEWQEPDDVSALKSLQLRGDMVTTDNSHY